MPDPASALTHWWAIGLLHEKSRREEEHMLRVVYAGRTPLDGADYLMCRHEMSKMGGFDHKIPDTAYVMTGTVHA